MTRHRHRCNDLNCPDCHPEYWQPADDSHQALAWPYAAALALLLIAFAFLYVSSGPVP